MLSPVELIFIAVVIWGTVFWLSMLLDCWRNEPRGLTRIVWTVVIALTHVVGALLYFLIRRPERVRSMPRSRSSRPGGKRKALYATLPVLLLGGGSVLAAQSPPAQQAPAPAAAPEGSRARLQLLPKLDHLFREGEGTSRPDDVQRPGNVSAEVVEAIADWISSRRTE